VRAILKTLGVLSILILGYANLARADAPPKVQAFRETDNITVDDKGDALYKAQMVFPDERTFLYMKRSVPDPKILLRSIIGPESKYAVDNVNVDFDSPTNSLQLTADVLGASFTDKRSHWQIFMGAHDELLFSDETDHKYVISGQSDLDGALLVTTSIVELPAGAKNVRMDSGKGMLRYDLDRTPKKGSADLDVDLKVKPRIMSAVYKVFANPDFDNGKFWIGKTVFHNTGEGDITHLKISYRIENYSDWSPTDEYGLVVAGGHVVNCYYPVLSKDLATLDGPTPVDVVVKYTYDDSDGQSHEDTTSARLTLMGCHQIEYSNTPEEDRTGAWTDDFSNSPLIAAFVNRNDGPVRKFEGMVAQACGGVPGGATDESTKKFCKALYDMMVRNGISYVFSTEYFVNYVAGQEIKYPREVLRDKAGTCVELAIFYAAVCESADIRCHLMMIPGHCFPVVVLPSGDLMPVEATAISGAALPTEMSNNRKTLPFFADSTGPGAVEIGAFEYTHERNPGKFYEIDVDDVQSKGVVCPELPAVGDDFLSQFKVYPEDNTTTPTAPQDQQGDNNDAPDAANSPVNLAGHFAGQFVNSVSGNSRDIQMDIAQDGSKLSVQITTSTGQAQLQGIVQGQQFSVEGRSAGGLTIRMIGKADGQTMTGKFMNSAGASGTFTLRRSDS
jgi:hypothetical protein